MTEEIKAIEEINEVTQQSAEEIAQEQVQAEQQENAQLEELNAALTEANVKLALVMGGVAKGRLSQGAGLAMKLIGAGASIEDAVQQVIADCPQLKLTERELPQFSAGSVGKQDGFAAIRNVFARR